MHMRWLGALIALLLANSQVAAQSVGTTYALLNGSATVQNVIVASSSFVSAQSGTWALSGVGCVAARIGTHWTGSQYVPPAPFPSWTQSTCFWVSPTAVPIRTAAMVSANQVWSWVEVSQQWAVIQD